MASGTYSRFIAAQVWPLLMNAPQNRPSAIACGSTSGSTMAASLPPSSRVSRVAAFLVVQRGPAGLGFRRRVDRRRHVAWRAELDPSDHLAGRRVLDLRTVVRADAA